MTDRRPRRARPLRLFGGASSHPALEWSWVEEQLIAAGTYWIVARGGRFPHPRPVWGLWLDGRLLLSIGSPVLGRLVAADPAVTAHLDSATDVVVLEGEVAGSTDDATAIGVYNEKYDWNYTVAEYGPLTLVAPRTVLAWCSTGWAGRGGITHTGYWTFDG